jgi:peptide/nickel transport system substrate-binding protein
MSTKGANGRSLILASVLAVSAVMLGACSSSSVEGGDVKNGGVLRIATSSGISSLNPFVGINQDDYSVWNYIYPHLLEYDTTNPEYDYMGAFATKWTVSGNGKIVTFHTQPGAQWSDGETLDAEDVAWTFNLIDEYADGPLGGVGQIVKNIASIEATDQNTVVFTYSKPTATALYDLGTTSILPAQVWEQYATGDGKDLKTFLNQPEADKPVVSGGPFMLTEYRKNDIALFEKNPNWYGADPHIDGFGLQYYTNEDAMVTALKTDQVDVIEQIPPTSIKTLDDAGMEVYEGPALSLRDLIINVNPDKANNRELLNPKVREAMEYATDRQTIVDTAWVGHASPGSTIVPAGSATGGVEWHNSDIETTPYDPDQANSILDSLGYERGSDGIRIADGHPMDYDLVFANDEAGAGTRAFQILQKDFLEIGIRINQKMLDANAAWNAIYCGSDCEYRDFDLAMWDWFPAADPDFILGAMTCAQWGNWNDTGYCNPDYDRLYEKSRHTIDPKKRQALVYEMQKMVYDARPYIILTYDSRLDAWSPKWDGFVESTQGMFNNFSTQSLLSVHQR